MKSNTATSSVLLLLAAGGAILAAGTACSNMTAPAVVAESSRDVPVDRHERARQLGKLVAQAYQETQGLSYEVVITRADLPAPIRCKVASGRNNRHHLQVYEESGRLFYELEASPIPGGVRIKENNYRGGEEADYEVCLTDYHTKGKWDMRCQKDTNACSFGVHLASWVGPKALQTAFWEKTISNGEYVGTEEVDGHACDLVTTHRVKNLIEEFYLDRKTHVIRRWFHNYRGSARDRVFSNIKLVAESAKPTQ